MKYSREFIEHTVVVMLRAHYKFGTTPEAMPSFEDLGWAWFDAPDPKLISVIFSVFGIQPGSDLQYDLERRQITFVARLIDYIYEKVGIAD